MTDDDSSQYFHVNDTLSLANRCLTTCHAILAALRCMKLSSRSLSGCFISVNHDNLLSTFSFSHSTESTVEDGQLKRPSLRTGFEPVRAMPNGF